MNEFVEQCRREWRRLGVRGAVADEMAAELAADLDEGASPEEVLGSDAADARSFAGAWARERGVVPRRTRNPRVVVPVAAAALALVAIAGAVLMVTASSRKASQSVASAQPRDPLLPPLDSGASTHARVYEGPPLRVRYVTVNPAAFKASPIRVKSTPAVEVHGSKCVDGSDFTATACVWSASDFSSGGSENSGVDWPRVGLGVTLFGGVGLILLASAWLLRRAARSNHVIP